MKALLMDLLADQPDGFQARSTAREYLQARILLALQDHGAFTDWAFLGGTALRFLYRLPRYSEDLDFSLATPGADARFERLMHAVRNDLAAEAYAVEVTLRTRAAVAIGMVRFRGLLHEAGLSPHAAEVLRIRVDLDTNPAAGATTETRLIRRSACSTCSTMTVRRCSPASCTRCSRAVIPRGETSTISPGISPIRSGRPRTSPC